MTPAQEKKLDALHELALEMKGKLDVQDEKFKQHFQAIVDTRTDQEKIDKRLVSVEKDRDKATGAMWILGTGFLGSIATAIISFFKSH